MFFNLQPDSFHFLCYCVYVCVYICQKYGSGKLIDSVSAATSGFFERPVLNRIILRCDQ